MPEYLSPGVYVEEVDRGPKPIEGVGTAMPAFVGFTERAALLRRVDGEEVREELLNKPALVTNWSQYVQRFGEFAEGAYLPHAVYGYFNNGGSRCYVVSVRTMGTAEAPLDSADGQAHWIARAKQAGLSGGRLRVRIEEEETAQQPQEALRELEANADDAASDEGATPAPAENASPPNESASSGADTERAFSMVVERQRQSGAWIEAERLTGMTLAEVEEGDTKVEVRYRNNRASKWLELLYAEVAKETPSLEDVWPVPQLKPLALDAQQMLPAESSHFQGSVTPRSGIEGLEALDDVTMLCVPDLMSTPPGTPLDLAKVKAVQTSMIAHCEHMGDRVAILDAPPDMTPQEVGQWRMDIAGYDSSYAALYYPWIQVSDPVLNRNISIPPCGHMAGVWARSDSTVGVHKAPANEVVQGAVGLAYGITKGEQDTLNPNGVNCIRAFPGRGVRVWGARTLTSDPAWRYINVRRLFNFVEKSIERGTQWVVFEPNDMMLWARVRRDVGSFLSTVWTSGALFGASPGEAFYVKCDEELNPPESRDLGRLVVEIGMAPVKPAEFVIFRISQWAAGA